VSTASIIEKAEILVLIAIRLDLQIVILLARKNIKVITKISGKRDPIIFSMAGSVIKEAAITISGNKLRLRKHTPIANVRMIIKMVIRIFSYPIGTTIPFLNPFTTVPCKREKMKI
jgi:hypothetical protein